MHNPRRSEKRSGTALKQFIRLSGWARKATWILNVLGRKMNTKSLSEHVIHYEV